MAIKIILLLFLFEYILSKTWRMSGMAESVNSNIYGVYVDINGNIYYSASDMYVIYKKNGINGTATIFAGQINITGSGYTPDETLAVNATLFYPAGITGDNSGNIYFVDNCYVRKVNTSGYISTISGEGPCSKKVGNYSGDRALANYTTLGGPLDIAVDSYGNIFIGDQGGARVIHPKTNLTYTFYNASNCSIAENPINGDVYVADYNGNKILKVDVNSLAITNIMGNGTAGKTSDGSINLNSSMLNAPYSIRFLNNSQILVFVETGNNIVRQIDILSNTVTTIAGTGSTSKPAFDTSNSLLYNLYSPWAVALFSNGSFIVSQLNYHYGSPLTLKYANIESGLWVIAAVLVPVVFVVLIFMCACFCSNRKQTTKAEIEYLKPEKPQPQSQQPENVENLPTLGVKDRKEEEENRL